MKFDYERVWGDARKLFTGHRDMVFGLLGVFMFLPALAQGLFLPMPDQLSPDWNGIQAMMDYYSANVLPLFLVRLATLLGSGALLALLLRPGTAVGAAIGLAARRLPSLFVLSLVITFALVIGFSALIVPGLYLAGRTAVAEAELMAGETGGPLHAISRSFDLSTGHGWSIVGLLAIVLIVTWVLIQVLTIFVGIGGALVLPEDGVRILRALLAAIGATAFGGVLTLVSAALYRALAQPSKA